jgi:hypothetical protein
MSRSRRLQARHRSAVQVTEIANDSIHALNELYMSYYQHESFGAPDHVSTPFAFSGLPDSANPSASDLQAGPPSTQQARYAAHIYSCAHRFHRRLQSSDSPSDDSLSSIVMDQVSSHLISAGYTNSTASNAVPLVADRVALPSVAGAVNILDVLPAAVAAIYADPAKCLRPPGDELPMPRPRVYATPDEYIKLIHRMLASNMVEFTTTPAVINGLFGVPKPDGSIRLIVDGRPSCARFIDSPRVALPTPDLLPRLIVPPGQPLWVAKSDLSDFFYRFRIPTWMQPYFALPGVTSDALGLQSRFGAGVTIYPCLSVLAMGWSHSVFLTQTAHEHMLNTRTTLGCDDRITGTADLRVDRVRHLVYVDDLIILGLDRAAVLNAQNIYIAAAEALQLPVKPSKVVLPSCDGVDCLGIEVHGREHTVAPRADKLDRLRLDTVRVLQHGRCTGRDMASLVGRWTWIMLVARPSLSIFSAVYRFIESAGRRHYDIWTSVARELWTAARMSPLFVASLSSPWYSHVMAVDASLDGQGVVAARVPTDLVEVAARTSGSVAPKTAADEDIDHRVLNRPWSTLIATAWRNEEHINTLEIRSISTAVRRVLSNPLSIRCRLLVLSDSQVAVGALTKGRSSSHTLLRRIRPLSAVLLASGLHLFLRWIPSASNPADGPSRLFSA